MGPIAVRRLLRRTRRHLAGLLVLVALTGAIALHHSGAGMDGMHHGVMSPAAEMCLGVVTALGAAIVGVAIGLLALGRWGAVAVRSTAAGDVRIESRGPRSRAGPRTARSFFCVWLA